MSLGFNPDDVVNTVQNARNEDIDMRSNLLPNKTLTNTKSSENQIDLDQDTCADASDIPLMRMRVGSLMLDEENSLEQVRSNTPKPAPPTFIQRQSVASEEHSDRYSHNQSQDSSTFDQYFKTLHNSNSGGSSNGGKPAAINPFLQLGQAEQVNTVSRVASVRRQGTSTSVKLDQNNNNNSNSNKSSDVGVINSPRTMAQASRKKTDNLSENGLKNRWIRDYGQIIPNTQPQHEYSSQGSADANPDGPMKRYVSRKDGQQRSGGQDTLVQGEDDVFVDHEEVKLQQLEVKEQLQELGINYDVLQGQEGEAEAQIEQPNQFSEEDVEKLCEERQNKFSQKTLEAMPAFRWPVSRGRTRRGVNLHGHLVPSQISATQFTVGDVVVHSAPMHGSETASGNGPIPAEQAQLQLQRNKVSTLLSRGSPVRKSLLVGSGDFAPSESTVGRHHGKQQFLPMPVEAAPLAIDLTKYRPPESLGEVGVRVAAVVTASQERYGSEHFWVQAGLQKKLPFFAPLPIPVICILLSRAHITPVHKGTVACPLVPVVGDVYIILKGSLGLAEQNFAAASIGPGHCIGTLLYNETTSSSSPTTCTNNLNMVINTTMYIALEDSVLLHLTPGQYQHIVEQGLAAHLASTLTALSKVPMLEAAPPSLLQLARNSIPHNLPPHSLVISQGAARLDAGMYLLQEGSVVVARKTYLDVCQCKRACGSQSCPAKRPKAVAIQVNTLFAPCLIGELSLLTNSPREAHVYTATNSVLVRIPRVTVYEQLSASARQKLIDHARNTQKYSSETLVQQILRKQDSWNRLKQKLLSALVLTKNTIR